MIVLQQHIDIPTRLILFAELHDLVGSN